MVGHRRVANSATAMQITAPRVAPIRGMRSVTATRKASGTSADLPA